MKSMKFRSMKAKLILAICAMLVALSAVNLAVGLGTSYAGLLDNVRNNLQATIATAQIGIDNTLNLLENEVKVAAKSTPVTNHNSAAGSAAARASSYGWKCAAVADSQGRTYSTDPGMEGLDLSGNEYFQRALSGETAISTTFLDGNGELRFLICTPASDGKSVFIAVLDGMFLRGMIQDIVIGTSGNVFVLDKTGTMIANVREEMVTGRQNYVEIAKTDPSAASMGRVFATMASGQTGVDRYNFNGVPRIAAYAPLSAITDGWSVGAAAPIGEMTSSIGISVLGMTLSSIIALLLSILITVQIARKIADPVKRVSQRLELLAQGDIHSPAPKVTSRDEIGALAKSTEDLTRSLGSIVGDVEQVLSGVAKGDLTVASQRQYVGDFVPIQESIARILDALNDTLGRIGQAANQVAGGSEQVSGGARALSQGATEQASAVETLAATITEISDNVKKNADNAQAARDDSTRTGDEILRGNEQMQQMMRAMEEISGKSGEIGKIVKTIEDIAFQTNILALNAAVEAARAGVAGKGFAVVADEVRSLAAKSGEAAKSTTELISQTISAVEAGTKIASETAHSMLAMVEGSKQVVNVVDTIAEASQAQAVSIGQLSQGIDQISAVVQTNSATAQESAAASEELSSQAQTLKTLTGRFTLRDRARQRAEASAFLNAGD